LEYKTNIKQLRKEMGLSYLAKTSERRTMGRWWDEVVLSKTVLSNFRPKHANEWIGGHMASLFLLFIA
jgi:hypothetical protein